MIENVQPLGDRVLLKRLEDDEAMKHGLHVPDIAQVKSSKGRVIAVGEGRLIGDRIEPLPLKAGDIVLFSKYGAVEVNIDGEELLILRYDEIYFKQKLVALVSTQ
jgi:chaperonin GroES